MSGYLSQLGAAFSQPSMQQLMQGVGQVGQAATPDMTKALMAANPGMTPDMAAGATVAGAGKGAPAAGSSAPMSPQDALFTMMGNNLQKQQSLAPIMGLMDVGTALINKNVMNKTLMPAPGAFGMAHSVMGPLQFGSSQSPLLTYLSMLGAR